MKGRNLERIRGGNLVAEFAYALPAYFQKHLDWTPTEERRSALEAFIQTHQTWNPSGKRNKSFNFSEDSIFQLPDQLSFDCLRECPDENDRYFLVMEKLHEAHRLTHALIQETIDRNGKTPRAFAIEHDLDPGLFHRKMKSGSFSVRVSRLTNIAYSKEIRRSCHEVFLGEEHATRLPIYLSTLVSCLKGMDRNTRDCFFESAEAFFREAMPQYKMDETNTPLELLLYSRLRELTDDQYMSIKKLGADVSPALRRVLYRADNFLNSASGAERKDYYLSKSGDTLLISLDNLSYLAVYFGTTLDYFVAYDYTEFTGLVLFDLSASVSDPKTVRFISQMIRLPLSVQKQIAAHLLVRSQIALRSCNRAQAISVSV